MTFKSILIKKSAAAVFAIAAALPAFAEDVTPIQVPDAAEARANHCGFPSEQQYRDYIENYMSRFKASVGSIVKPHELDPEYPGFGAVRTFTDDAELNRWMQSGDLIAGAQITGVAFSQCQGLEMARRQNRQLAIITNDGKEGARLIPVPPQP